MKRQKLNLKYLHCGLSLFLILGLFATGISRAQSPQGQVIITWQANNFYPADYKGKALAVNQNTVTVAAELLKNQKLQDLSKATITWFLDDDFLSSGTNLKETTFRITKTKGDSHFVRAVVGLGAEEFEGTISIPVFGPVVVIENPNPYPLVKGETQLSLRAIPYFFNITGLNDLTLRWQINNGQPIYKSGSDNEIVLNVGSPQQGASNKINVTVFAQNQKNLLETNQAAINLEVTQP